MLEFAEKFDELAQFLSASIERENISVHGRKNERDERKKYSASKSIVAVTCEKIGEAG